MNFQKACLRDDIVTAKKLYTEGAYIHSDIEYVFRWSCFSGNFEIIEWLYSHGVDIDTGSKESAFGLSCRSGHIEVAKWLHSVGANIHACDEYAFRWTCYNGHFGVAQWLYTIGLININACNDVAFSDSCKYGHLEIAKWLYSLGDQTHNGHAAVNIHACNDEAFISSCKKGHLSIAKWLYSLGVDIHACDDEAFISSCQYEHFEIAKWFNEIEPFMLSKTIGKINLFDYEKLGISKESATLFKCIKTDDVFPEIYHIDENVLLALVHNNRVGQLTKLREQFSIIVFDIEDDVIVNFAIRPFKSKSARKI